jgi:FkbH-like protein
MDSMFFSEIISKNNKIKASIESTDKIQIKVLSNITLNQLKDVLEYSLNSINVFCQVEIGEYDNIIKETLEITNQIPLIFWEISNLNDGFFFNIENYDDEKINIFKKRVLLELDTIFSNLSNSKLVVFNTFSHLAFSGNLYEKSKFQKFVEEINNYLYANKPQNFEVIEIDKAISKCSITKSFNFRNFYTNKSLYSIDFFKSYTKFIRPIFRSLSGMTKKCIVLDCDNTLWSGIIGEDGPENVYFNISDSGNGIYFHFVNSVLKSLHGMGVILCLASKNNYADVESFFKVNKLKTLLSFEDFIIKKINWENKHQNLIEIAEELNIGLDSIVFIDDSDFEIDLVEKFLPEVTCLKVPKILHEYPHFAINFRNLFFKSTKTNEDLNRNMMYMENLKRNDSKSSFSSVDDYILSLKIQIEISNDDIKNFERLSQLTLKTNQFNLSTKRYELVEIKSLIKRKNSHLLSLRVSDSFGDFGVTALCIIIIEDDFAYIDTLLMSCRILGRKIEYAFVNEIVKFIYEKNPKVESIKARYVPTNKNAPIKMFFDEKNYNSKKLDNGDIEYILNREIKNNNNQLHEIRWKKD